jgi:hypothetical protein
MVSCSPNLQFDISEMIASLTLQRYLFQRDIVAVGMSF